MTKYLSWFLLLPLCAYGQITVAPEPTSPGQIGLGKSYEQDFNSLPRATPGTTTPWENNITLRGWYAFSGNATSSAAYTICTSGATGTVSAKEGLFSMAQHFDTVNNNSATSTWRALGVMPASTGTPATLALRLRNQNPQPLTGLRVSWETKWAYTGTLDAKGKPAPVNSTHSLKLLWRKATADDAKTSKPGEWREAYATRIENHDTSIPDCWNHYNVRLTDLNIAKDQEIWLAWEITRTDGEPSIIALDNVRVTDFAAASPALTAQSFSQSVLDGHPVTYSVEATGHGPLTYQWLRDGTPLPSQTAPQLTLPKVGRADDGASFSCRITSAEGSITSAPNLLKVYAPHAVRGPKLPANLRLDLAGYTADASLADVAFLPAGRREFADLYLPDPLPERATAVLIVHGGGGNNGDKRQAREAAAGIDLARRGYVALSINYKMSGKTGASWPRNVQDAFHAVRWLRANAGTYHLDPEHIGAVGFSWGCNTVAMLSVIRPADTFEGERLDGVIPGDAATLPQFSSRVQAVCAYYGAVDPGNYHQMNMHGATTTADDAPDRYRAASPVNYAHSDAAPTYLSHGTADTDVLMTQIFTLRDRLRDAGAFVQMHLEPFGEHSYALYDRKRIHPDAPAGHIIDERPRVLGFFDHFLKNPAPTLSFPNQPVPPRPTLSDSAAKPIPTTAPGQLPAIEASIHSNAPDTDVDEPAVGYLAVKYSETLRASRKVYFQFALPPAGSDSAALATSARFTVEPSAAFRQNVQLWALDQACPDFSATATWRSAPANDLAGPGLLRTGPTTATPLDAPTLLPNANAPELSWSIPDLRRFVKDGKLTLALTAAPDPANNPGGLRIALGSARLILDPPASSLTPEK